MRLATVIGGFGRLLIWVGAVVLLFVGYQLWGTNLAEARAQEDLEDGFEELMSTTAQARPATTTTTAAPRPTTTAATTTTATTVPAPVLADGEAAARIVIPAIGVDKIVVEGVSRSDLRKGPGHYPGTPMPGQSGNAAIAGHRTTYGAPFHRIDELRPGDDIVVTTPQGTFDYRVTGSRIVPPSEVDVIDDKGDDRLTLTSCHPKYSDRERIVVTAELVQEPAPAPPATDVPRDEDVNGRPGPTPASTGLEVLDGDRRGPVAPAAAWGVVASAVWFGIPVLGRRWRRWPSYLVGAPVLAIALFAFFDALSKTLPPNF